MEIPNLSGFADPQNVSQKGTGSFKASYINWARTLHDIRENAKGWMPEMIENVHGEQVHPCPDGTGYLMIRFRHVDGTKTTAIPHAIMDHKMHPIKGDRINSRDVSDSFVRGACKCAAAVFGYAWEMWSKDDQMERTAEEDKEIESLREERAKKNVSAQAEQTEEEILYVGNEITDQHSTPQGWLEENDPIAVQDSVQQPVAHWRDVKCPFKAHKGKTLGAIVDEGNSGYLAYFADRIDTITSEDLKIALKAWAKENNQDGQQGFKRVG